MRCLRRSRSAKRVSPIAPLTDSNWHLPRPNGFRAPVSSVSGPNAGDLGDLAVHLIGQWQLLWQNIPPSMVVPGTNSTWSAPLRTMLVGLGCFLFGSLSDLWLLRHGVSLSVALIDDALVGIGVGLLVFLYERRQGRSITERNKAENAVRESEERFRLAMS